MTGQYLLTAGRSLAPHALRHTTIMSEFIEMPGMRLTLAQAARLWSLDAGECERLLDDLVRAGFLRFDEHGRYARRVDRPRRADVR
jgi:hypothetical protein